MLDVTCLARAKLRKQQISWNKPLAETAISAGPLSSLSERGDKNAMWLTANDGPDCVQLEDVEFHINVKVPGFGWIIVTCVSLHTNWIFARAVLSQHSAGRTTGISIDSGEDVLPSSAVLAPGRFKKTLSNNVSLQAVMVRNILI